MIVGVLKHDLVRKAKIEHNISSDLIVEFFAKCVHPSKL